MQTWIDIISDPHHWIADFIMNIASEIIIAFITYKVIIKKLNSRKEKSLQN